MALLPVSFLMLELSHIIRALQVAADIMATIVITPVLIMLVYSVYDGLWSKSGWRQSGPNWLKWPW